MIYDVIIAGLGGMGSAAFFEAAKRGLNVLALDPNPVAHDLGSSHGETRLIRQAYFEHPDYVPLLRRAYEHWDDRNARAQAPVFHRTGLLIFAPTLASGLLHNVLGSARHYNIPVEVIDRETQRRCYPQYAFPAGSVGVLEPGAGYLDVERCVRLHVDLGISAGGTWRQDGIVAWGEDKDGCRVRTAQGHEYRARKLVLCLGPWSPELADLPVRLTVRRVPLFWFKPKTRAFQTGPCFAFDFGEGFFYGFREQGGLVKVAPHIPGEPTSPLTLDRAMRPDDQTMIEDIVRRYLPVLHPQVIAQKVCMYTMSDDEHFFIDRHPRYDHVFFVAGLSGHGFKFAPVIGEILIDLATTGATAQPCGFLRVGRLTPS